LDVIENLGERESHRSVTDIFGENLLRQRRAVVRGVRLVADDDQWP
jgi:hypothetical protein